VHRPRKRFGQHFLHDPKIISRIADAIDPKPDDRLIEIGPGQGALTAELLKRIPSLTAIEIDRDLAAELTSRFGENKLKLHVGDVLDVDFTALRGDGPKLRIVGNLPYNISTPLLFHLLQHRESIRDMYFMLQKEVVDRMAAPPGSKTYGRLTVMLAPWVKVESLFIVGPGAFRPPPKVSSAIVRLTPWDPLPFVVEDTEKFETIVRSAFSKRRKTLRNTLKGMIGDDAIAALGIDPGLRPEQLTPAQFAQLAGIYAEFTKLPQ
jgi:16S rRNA (adenine1518-N6/adenine1519-N6)-dimethyltransferase